MEEKKEQTADQPIEQPVEQPAEQPAEQEQPAVDTAKLIDDIKNEYQQKLVAQASKYETRLKERDAIIKQLMSDEPANSRHSFIDKLNAHIEAQKKY